MNNGRIAYICLNSVGNLFIGRLIENGCKVDIIKSKADIKLIKKQGLKAVIVHISSAQALEIDIASSIKLSLGLENIKYIVITEYKFRNIINKAIDIGASDIITDVSNSEQVIKKISEIAGIIPEKSANDIFSDTDFILLSFNELIVRELKAAARGNYELSIATLYPETDMGPFTEVTGDFLNSIKVIFTKFLRDTDYVFIHNKTILVILPFADEEGCGIVVDRLKETYKSHPALKPVNIYTNINSLSATFPKDGRTAEKLLEKASPA